MSFMKSSLVKVLAVSAAMQLGFVSVGFSMITGKGTEIVDKKDTKWSGVVQLTFNGDKEICTGTVIHPNIIVTAAHCIFEKSPESFSSVGVKFGNGSSVTRVNARYQQAPGYNSTWIRQGSTNLLGKDVMIIVTQQSLTSINPSLKLINFAETREEAISFLRSGNEIVMGYGFGKSPESDKTASTLGTKRMRVVNYDFNSKHAAFTSLADSKDVLKKTGGNGGQCQGDSGGGLYVERNGQIYTVGVLSGVGGKRCAKDQPTGYVDLSQHICWIQKASGIDLKLNKQCSN